jgi:methyl-accepting chemotaxis protein
VLPHGDNALLRAYYRSMQLRRGPPSERELDSHSPQLHLIKAPKGPFRTPSRRLTWRSFDAYSVRAVAGLLLVSIPVSVLLGLVVSNFTTQTSIDVAMERAEATAATTAVRVVDWVTERKAQLRAIAQSNVGQLSKPGLNARLVDVYRSQGSFDGMQIFDQSGRSVASTDPRVDLSSPSSSSFAESLTVETLGPIQLSGLGLDWRMTSPIVGTDSKAQGVIVGNLNVAVLGRLLNPFGLDSPTEEQEVHLVNAQHLLLYSSSWGVLKTAEAEVAHGALQLEAEGATFELAMKSGPGAAQIVDYRGHEVLAGYEPVPSLRWVVIASIDTATALAPVREQALRTSMLQTLSTILLIGFAIVLAVFMTRPIVALSRAAAQVEAGDLSARVNLKGGGEVRRLSDAFNAMVERLSGVLLRLRGEVAESATKLSAVAEQLASATFEQTTAATATSASMEELSRSSAAVAETVDRVAIQAAQTQASLELAQADLKASGDRTLALAGRVNEIEGILELINDIADQTNLLALNAAIEAARAGDSGRGFAVVADEVRRLAERSKAAAAQIASLVEGAQSQSSETVMALEKGVKQMERGLVMMQAVVEAGGQVQVASKVQRSTTEQVVLAIEHIAEGSRSVAATAQEIAAAAARQGELAAELAGSGWEEASEAQRGA